MKTKFFILLIIHLSLACFAQKTYYKIINEKITLNQKEYTSKIENYKKESNLEELVLKTITKKDSIIKYVRLTVYKKGVNDFDPYAGTKKKIGSRFEIEKFSDNNGKKFKMNYLDGKPTFINFWFTRCPPCIEEIPLMNQLKEKYGNQVNFITITFNDKTTVDEFLKTTPFNFKHIVNAKSEINRLEISAFPTNLILDKNGIIQNVFPVITYDTEEINIILDHLVL